jgi:hypothetical protein
MQDDCDPTLLYRPPGHTVQLDAAASEYCPVPQATHGPPLPLENCPALQLVHMLTETAPTMDVVPPGQVSQLADPGVSAYLPMPQLLQPVPPTAPMNCPREQLVHAAAPLLGEYWPAAHAAHAVPPGEN